MFSVRSQVGPCIEVAHLALGDPDPLGIAKIYDIFFHEPAASDRRG